MSFIPLDIYQVIQRLRPDVNYNPQAFRDNAWIEALVVAINENSSTNYSSGVASGMPLIASVEEDITISGNVVTSDTPLWTSTGGTLLVVAALRLLTPTTMGTFEGFMTHTENGITTNPSVGTLNLATAIPHNAYSNTFIYADSGSTFGWNYEVAGFFGSNASVRISLKAYLAA